MGPYQLRRLLAGTKSAALLAIRWLVVMACILPAQAEPEPGVTPGETRLAATAESGSPDLRGAAVVDLARLGSEFYPTARDAVAADPDPAQIVDLLNAICAANDTSETASAVVERTLGSGAFSLAQKAAFAARKGVPIRLHTVWTRDRLMLPWSWHGDLAPWLTRATGAAELRPWRDSVWKSLPLGARVQLLSRAGTCEAAELLQPLLTGENAAVAHRSLVTAERGEAECLDPFLTQLAPAVAVWASRSLVRLGKLGHLEAWLRHPVPDLRRHAVDALIEAGDTDGITKATRKTLSQAKGNIAADDQKLVVAAIPLLGDDELLKLLSANPGIARTLRSEFDTRGLLSSAQLNGEVELESGISITALTGSLHAGLLRDAVLREQRTELLPDLIADDLDAQRRLGTLSRELLQRPSFLEALTPEAAHACVELVEAWLDKQGALPDLHRLRGSPAHQGMVLLGLVARGPDADRIWRAWRESKRPLDDARFLVPVLHAPTVRSAEVRGLVSNTRFEIGNHHRDVASELPVTSDLPLGCVPGVRVRHAERPLLAPALEAGDRSWLEGIVAAERRDQLRRAIKTAVTGGGMIACGIGPDTSLGVRQPHRSLVTRVACDQEPDLEAMLADDDPQIRRMASIILWRRFGSEAGLSSLRRDAENHDPAVRFAALKSLQLISDPQSVERLVSLMGNSDPRFRRLGLQAVATFKIRERATDVVSLAFAEDRAVAAEALRTLGELGIDATVPLLVRAASASEAGTVSPLAGTAATALGQFHEKEHVDRVVAAMLDPGLDGATRRRLLQAFDSMTFRLGRLPLCSPRPDIPSLLRSSAERWQQLRELSLSDRVLASVAMDIAATRAAIERGDEEITGGSLALLFDLELRNTMRRDRLRTQLEDLERLLAGGDPWALLSSKHARFANNLALMRAVDRHRTASLLLIVLLQERLGSTAGHPGLVHQELVRTVGVDLGDPGLAIADYRDDIRRRWWHWARSQDWWSLP